MRHATLHDARREAAVTLSVRPVPGWLEVFVDVEGGVVWGRRALAPDPTALVAFADALRTGGAAALEGPEATVRCGAGRLEVELSGPDLAVRSGFAPDPARIGAFADDIERLVAPPAEEFAWRSDRGWLVVRFEPGDEAATTGVSVEGAIAVASFEWRGQLPTAAVDAFRKRPEAGPLVAPGLSLALAPDGAEVRLATADLEVSGSFSGFVAPSAARP